MALSPLMQQILEIKEQVKDCFLFTRVGDFYELFFDDAHTVSKELDLTLTGKDCGLPERAPMCGVPYHAVDTYVKKLIERGYKVAICEQLEDPATAKGLVKRGITRIITPGTISEASLLDEGKDSFILSIYEKDNECAVAYCDVSTGKFLVEETELEKLNIVLLRIRPKEILYPKTNTKLDLYLKKSESSFYLTPVEEYDFALAAASNTLLSHFKVKSFSSFGIDRNSLTINAAGGLFSYLADTQKNDLNHIKKIIYTSGGKFMVIDPFTSRNLELTENMMDKTKRGTLLSLLDKTKTAMGSRLIREWIEQPLLEKKEINRRLDGVNVIKNNLYLRNEIRNCLDTVYDIERLLSRISYNSLDARDLVMIRSSLRTLPYLKELLSGSSEKSVAALADRIDPLQNLYELLNNAIADNPPVSIREGGFIKEGYSEDVDKLRHAKSDSKTWLSNLEAREKEETGIRNLKIGFNKVFGYYIEVTNSFKNLVPERYIRRQTLVGGERYITDELKEIEELLLTSEDRVNKLEYQIFTEIKEEVSKYMDALQQDSEVLAIIDALSSLALVAYNNNYVRPEMNDNGVIEIKNGRHPVVEASAKEDFIPNDILIDNENNNLLIITGPNMAGKSTFMRQTALIVLMAQIGSFVPATSARIGIVDRIFTRVGASDDLSSGQSTFMVEMNELASILNNATKNSLLILDEIGRGTSTLDGLSIAWATIEYIISEGGIGAKTLFATHYHELIALEKMLPGIRNYSVGVKEINKQIIFLHKIVAGGADKSFGIEVAKLAGLPDRLLYRAKSLLGLLEQQSKTDITEIDTSNIEDYEVSRINEKDEKVLDTLRNIDINTLTPFEALSILNELKGNVSR